MIRTNEVLAGINLGNLYGKRRNWDKVFELLEKLGAGGDILDQISNVTGGAAAGDSAIAKSLCGLHMLRGAHKRDKLYFIQVSNGGRPIYWRDACKVTRTVVNRQNETAKKTRAEKGGTHRVYGIEARLREMEKLEGMV